MTEISRTALFGKLNRLGYQAIESATVFCKMRGNPIIHGFGLESSRLAQDFTNVLDRLPRGSRSISDLSSDVESVSTP